MKTNIFVENNYPEFEVDDVKFHDDTKKMFDYAVSLDEIKHNFCLKNKVFDTVFFDIVFCNDDEIHRINRDYRNTDRPTDVITFAIFADSPDDEKFIFDGEINLGEIIISLDTIKKQAEENKTTFDDELRLITAHGILHLLGFDHLTEDDYNFVVSVQNKVKSVLNV